MLKDILFRESIPALQQGLDVAALRQKLTADNIANVNTPGFQARHVAFEELLAARGQAALTLRPAAPSEGRAAGGSGQGIAPVSPRVVLDTSPQLKSGVNNVDVEREMAGIQENSLLHAAMAQLISAKYKMIHQAIVDR